MANERVYFAYTSNQSTYDQIATKDDNTLYCVLDSQRVYKGGVDITQSVVFVTSFLAVFISPVFKPVDCVVEPPRAVKATEPVSGLTVEFPAVVHDVVTNPPDSVLQNTCAHLIEVVLAVVAV